MRDWLTKDFGWKLFSVFLAIAVWLTIHNFFQPTISEEANVDITYSDRPVMAVSVLDGKRVEIVPATVMVKVKGPANVMSVLQANQIRPLVNLNGVESGRNLRRSVEVAVPTRVTFVDVEPSEVAVTVSSASETNQEAQP